MKNRRRLGFVAALVLALGTGLLLLDYLGTVHASAAVVKTREVYVAARDIPARSLLTDAYVVRAQRAASDLDADAIGSRDEIAGKYALITIPAGSVLTRSKVGAGGAAALPARLPVGMRAVSISIDRVKGVAGLIQPGDRVDVIAVPPRVGDEIPQASAILRGVLVLAMGNEVETASATPSPGNQDLTTVTLALTPRQVDLLAAADLNTTLRLALRSPKEPVDAFAPETLQLGVRAAAAAAPPVVERVVTVTRHVSVPVALPRTIQLIDGDQLQSGSLPR